jgi:hypothetical protein
MRKTAKRAVPGSWWLARGCVARACIAGMVIGIAGCPGSSGQDGGTDAAGVDVATDHGPTCSAGGPVTGAADMHCSGDGGPVVQRVNPAVCHPDAGAGADAAAGDGGDMMPDYGDTMYNAAGDDDDCKYHVTWTATPICQDTDVTFTVTATYKTDGSPVRMAATRAEVLLSDTHPAPNTLQTPTETAPGVYTVGPVRFDASGMWTVRFHFFETCTDSEESPHGHAAFYVSVP